MNETPKRNFIYSNQRFNPTKEAFQPIPANISFNFLNNVNQNIDAELDFTINISKHTPIALDKTYTHSIGLLAINEPSEINETLQDSTNLCFQPNLSANHLSFTLENSIINAEEPLIKLNIKNKKDSSTCLSDSLSKKMDRLKHLITNKNSNDKSNLFQYKTSFDKSCDLSSLINNKSFEIETWNKELEAFDSLCSRKQKLLCFIEETCEKINKIKISQKEFNKSLTSDFGQLLKKIINN